MNLILIGLSYNRIMYREARSSNKIKDKLRFKAVV